MLDFSWAELFFVAVLALIILGPKDLPQLFHIVGKFIAKVRRMYADLQGSILQLEKEVNIASGKGKKGDDSWRDLLPPELRELPADFRPGTISAAQHQQRQEMITAARNQHAEATANAAKEAASPVTQTSSNIGKGLDR
ncbi:preprotein translocase subunit TatB [Alteromonas pelagimontana]|uniref:Preprotein translocase subunit TatB n=1 Tax=Alteromonas pelagimontana TaxID=1858656 RepID=A0A6M4MIE6_9ALTE|nr:preprotein translocase subunit TatB [Alteromonas pelagimontana]QJR82405.1 preprotein translocase subunit TatB [Alteromonas pelagimontana]